MARITNKQRAINFGECFANNMFNMMLDTENQGDKFCWEQFPQNFETVCRASLFQSYPKTPKNLTELEDIASFSFITAGEILKKNFPRTLPQR